LRRATNRLVHALHDWVARAGAIQYDTSRSPSTVKLAIVKGLVEAGADIRARDKDGRTPLEAIEAMEPKYVDVSCYPPITEYLRARGGAR